MPLEYRCIKVLLLSACVALLSCGGGEGSSSDGRTSQSGSNSNTNPTGTSPQPISFDAVSEYDPSVFSDDYDYFGRGEINQSFYSSITGVTYGYHVYLPPEYDLEPNRRFPVMYITDAQFDVSFQAKVLDNEARPVIMVGIDEGPRGRRAIDYILPGAERYFQFFTEEFIPAIENQYRITSADRTFAGTSAGGQASLVMLLLDTQSPPIFRRHFSFDPYITTRVRSLLDDRVSRGDTINKSLFISAAYGARGLGPSVNSFVDYLRAQEINGLHIHERTYNVSHEEVNWASFSTALSIAYD